MPIIKSAIKRAKQSLVRRSRNLSVKRAIKQDVTALHAAVAENDTANAQTRLSAAYSEIDRAVKKHTIHKNTAARRKGQLAAAVAGMDKQAESGKTATPTTTQKAKSGATKTKSTTAKAKTTTKAVKAPAAKKPAK